MVNAIIAMNVISAILTSPIEYSINKGTPIISINPPTMTLCVGVFMNASYFLPSVNTPVTKYHTPMVDIISVIAILTLYIYVRKTPTMSSRATTTKSMILFKFIFFT